MGETVAKAGLVALLLVAGSLPVQATSLEAIRTSAAEVSTSEIKDGEWPFSTLPPALRAALDRAVLQEDVEGAVDGLAAALGGDRTAAASVLGATVEVFTDFFPGCRGGQDAERSEQIEGELLSVIADHAEAEEALAATALFYDLREHCLEWRGDHLVERLGSLQDGAALAERLALKLDEGSDLRRRVLGVAAGGSPSLVTLETMADSVDSMVRRAALLEQAEAAARLAAPERVPELERRHIEALLSAGLPDAAVEAFRAASQVARESIRAGEEAPVEDDDQTNDLRPDVRLDLAAALALVRDGEGARELLAAIPADRRVLTGPARATGHDATEARVWQILDRLVSAESTESTRRWPDEPFDLLAELALSVDSFGDEGIAGRGTLYEALTELALREGYGGFARFFFHSLDYRVAAEGAAFDPSETPDGDPFSEGFPRSDRAARDLYDRLVLRREVLANRLSEGEPPDPMTGRIGELLSRPRLVPFRERPLPEGVPVGSRGDADLPPGLSLPRDLGIVRAERRGDEAVVVGLAQALDPVGEVSAGGYWIARSTDGGASWRRLYTGLRHLQPYEVVERSALPLIADGGARIEVRVRELDESSITFPPIGLQVKREEDGLFLELPWDELERDSDGDGLTDLVEERLLSDPETADSDGDGVEDAEDPLPTVAFTAASDPSSEALAALLGAIGGEEARAILPRCPDGDSLCFGRPHLGEGKTHFVLGERSRWAGLAPRQRTIVLTPEELEVVRERFGVLFATRFPLVEVDHRAERAVVIWSRAWQGGAAYLRRGDDGWKVEIRSIWIT